MPAKKFRKMKIGKIVVVIFITVLIWVWADLALDQELSDKPAVIVVDESVDQKLWISFDQASSADFKITLSGPHTAIAEVNKRLRQGKPLEFIFDAVQEKMDKPGVYSLNLLFFLQKDSQIRRLGLKVKSCEPEALDVHVIKLVKKQLAVQCFDEDGMPVKAESIEPAKVDMFVPENWELEKLIAKVQLSRREINQARLSDIDKTPYVELAEGQRRDSSTAVKIKMPPAEDALTDYKILNVTLGFILGENLQGKYEVKVTNLLEVRSPVAIKATPEASQAYKDLRYQVILEIDDEDIKDIKKEDCRREVVYNFPEDFVRKNEIMLNQTPVQARFKLVEVPVSTVPTESP